MFVNSFKYPAEIIEFCPQIMDEEKAEYDRPVIKKQTKQKAPPAVEQKTAQMDLCPATSGVMCHFSPWPGPYFPSFGNPKDWKVNRT